jgi:hypothetical protein
MALVGNRDASFSTGRGPRLAHPAQLPGRIFSIPRSEVTLRTGVVYFR